MQRISISELCSLRWSFYQDIIRYAAAGFGSVGIWRQKIEDTELNEAVDFLNEMQMDVSSVHWAGGFTGGNGLSFHDSIDDAIDAIELTSILRGKCLIVHPGCRNGHTSRHAQRLFREALQELTPVADDHGVQLAIEPMPCQSAAAWTFMETLNSSLELLQHFPTESLGLVLDLYHVGLNPDLYEELDQYIDRIALVQLSDRKFDFSHQEQRLLLGTGNVAFEKWLQRFQELGYTGQFEIELHGAGQSDIEYSRMLSETTAYLRSLDQNVFNESPFDPSPTRHSGP